MTVNILERVEALMAEDTEPTEKQSALIEDAYTEASTGERAVVDVIFTALCGYRLCTILAGEDQP